MLIRTEAPADILPIDQLLKQVFPSEYEANLVMKLRENAQRTLSLVACTDEGEVIGHLLFSPVTLNGQDMLWQGLAPLAVHPDHQRQGIGQALVREGLESLRDFGYPVCVVLGDPAYYGKQGFISAQSLGFDCAWEAPEGAFQIVELQSHQCHGHAGRIDYCREFYEA